MYFLPSSTFGLLELLSPFDLFPTLFLAHQMGISKFLPVPTILNQDRIKITCGQCMFCIGGHVPASSSDIGFRDEDVNKTATLRQFLLIRTLM